MEAYEKLLKLIEIPAVWDMHEHLYLDNEGVPHLWGVYKIDRGDDWIEVDFKYIDGQWVKQESEN